MTIVFLLAENYKDQQVAWRLHASTTYWYSINFQLVLWRVNVFHCCFQRILTTEFIDGVKISDKATLKDRGISLPEVWKFYLQKDNVFKGWPKIHSFVT